MIHHSQHTNINNFTSNHTTINNNNTVTFLIKNKSSSYSVQSASSSSSSSLRQEDADVRDTHEATSYSSSPTCCYNNLKLNPPIDSAMALTVLVLLTALFFMGFFSIYIRRFADENNADPTRHRRRIGARWVAGKSCKKGVCSSVVEMLPVYAYNGCGGDVEKGGGKMEERECAICLSEFEEKELVKEIPYCGHVFHVECIVTWLLSHVTCPLCRTAEFFGKDVGGPSEQMVSKEKVVNEHVSIGREEGVTETYRESEEEV